MIRVIKRAIKDMWANRFLNAVTVVTVALSILIVGAFALFFVNASALLSLWTKEIRIMAYLEAGMPTETVDRLGKQMAGMPGVGDVRFVSKEQAMERLRQGMTQGSALLDTLEENPLPDAYEVHMAEAFRNRDRFELLARQIGGLEGVSEVEYGKEWLNRFVRIIDLFRLTGLAMGGLFFLAAAFIVANTVRLVLYSRRDEIEILRLMGGSEGFIRGPFYMQGILQGALGGAAGMGMLFGGFRFVADKVAEGGGFLPARFLPDEMIAGILVGSMAVGWIGSYISLRQVLKTS